MSVTKEQLKVFGEKAARILWPILNKNLTDEQLREIYPAADRRYRECFHPPSYEDMAMHVANEVIGGCGVEGWATGLHSGVSYVNLGDTYITTIVLDEDDEFHVRCWGDFAPDEEDGDLE